MIAFFIFRDYVCLLLLSSKEAVGAQFKAGLY